MLVSGALDRTKSIRKTAADILFFHGQGLLLKNWSCKIGGGGGGRNNQKKLTVFLDPLQKWRRGGAPAPPNGVRISEPPYGGGDRIP